ncbi:phosphatidylinositol N-acetylglucosaminyltransferase [Pleurotus eryngii]|uniref:Phosphatidylinositol N-acetylglucosaminyltransferase n=1 Tax=Pleurotus eryngii TaxID=5323 RepID=A0A9P5ZNR4_PLEER|nr:phosphatidylinositol N-acetylglucosaminyltransferase [Pleurotus eryngii]
MGHWEKVLWRRQPFLDNYIPPDAFLSSLRTNPNFQPYTYWSVVLLSSAVTQHLSSLFIFLGIYVRLKDLTLHPHLLVWSSVCCFVVGYVAWVLLDLSGGLDVDYYANFVTTLKSSILMFLALMSLSPVLRTLTAATSSDSIWALSAALFLLNILLADYSSSKLQGHTQERLTSVLSMNAAISSSVVLASRLSDDLSVFALVLFAVEAFALFPMFRHRLQDSPVLFQSLLTITLASFSLVLTASISTTITWLFFFALFGITFIAPGVLIWAQRYKNEIRGPWDVAVPRLN